MIPGETGRRVSYQGTSRLDRSHTFLFLIPRINKRQIRAYMNNETLSIARVINAIFF